VGGGPSKREAVGETEKSEMAIANPKKLSKLEYDAIKSTSSEINNSDCITVHHEDRVWNCEFLCRVRTLHDIIRRIGDLAILHPILSTGQLNNQSSYTSIWISFDHRAYMPHLYFSQDTDSTNESNGDKKTVVLQNATSCTQIDQTRF
jgi:hypothetical protein